jgi:hypothetical protein
MKRRKSNNTNDERTTSLSSPLEEHRQMPKPIAEEASKPLKKRRTSNQIGDKRTTDLSLPLQEHQRMPKAVAEGAVDPPRENDSSSREENTHTEVADLMQADVELVAYAHVDPNGSVDTHQRADIL